MARPFLFILLPSVSLFHGCDRGGTAAPALVCELAGSPAARGSQSVPPGAWGTQAQAP